MIPLRVLLSRLLGHFARQRREAELSEEIQAHLDLLASEHIRRGMPASDARAAARRTFGGVEQVKESYRDQRGLPLLDDFIRDVRIALRTSLTNRAFSAVVVTTLALGIGATVGMFTVLEQVVLQPLPYPDSGRLVRLQSPVPGIRPDAVWNLSTAEYFYFRQQAQSLDGVGIYVSTTGTLAAITDAPGSTAERVLTALVSSEVFRLLGIQPVRGRAFTEAEGHYNLRTESPPAVILSYDVWQKRFGGSDDVIGRSVTFEDRAFPIVGVLGPGIELPETAFVPTAKIGIWMPLGLDPNAPAVNQHTFRAIARLHPGVALPAAQAELETLTSRLPGLFPSAYSPEFMTQTRFSTQLVPLREDLLGSARRMIWVLAGAIGLVFMITAANVANLFLARTETRRRELAVRLALGATRMHVVRHALAESLLLCVAAAAIGIGLASAALRVLIALAPASIPRLTDVRINDTGVAAALATAMVASALFAAFTSARSERDPEVGLRQQRPTASLSQRRTRSMLVAAQVALALVLAAGAVLMARSVRHLVQVDPGFDAGGVVAFDLVLPRTRYTTEQRVADYYRELSAALEADPEIEHVGAATTTPLDGNDGCTAVVVEDQTAGGARRGACVDTPRVTAGFFEALQIAIRGRAPEWADVKRGAVVSESLARRLWPGEDPIGKGIRANGNGPPYYRVIGIAADVHRNGFDRPPAESVYFPVVSQQGAPLFGPARGMRVVIRTRRFDAAAVMPRVRSTLTSIDANVPIANVHTMNELVRQSMARTSFTTSLLVVAALLAILLSGVGLYGVISYGVASRRNELGVRLALGARPSTLRGMIIRETLAVVMIGLSIGIVAALASTQFLAGLLFGVTPRDPVTLVSVTVFLLCIGAAAGAIPAWRASETDPLIALRSD